MAKRESTTGKRTKVTVGGEPAGPALLDGSGRRGRPRKEIPYVPVKAGAEVETIPLDKIDLDDATFKFRVNLRLGSLVDSIREGGQQFPVLLRRGQGKKKYQIISGFRRIAAIRKLGWDRVNAVVRTDLRDDAEAFKVSIIENEERETYNDLDRAYAILKYRGMGKSTAEVEEIFRVGARQRQRLEELTRFPPRLQEAVAAERVSSTNAVRLMQHVRRYPQADLKKWIAWIEENNATYGSLGKALRQEAAASEEAAPIELYVERERDGKKSVRIRPIAIDGSITSAQKTKLLEDLKAVMEFVEKLPA